MKRIVTPRAVALSLTAMAVVVMLFSALPARASCPCTDNPYDHKCESAGLCYSPGYCLDNNLCETNCNWAPDACSGTGGKKVKHQTP